MYSPPDFSLVGLELDQLRVMGCWVASASFVHDYGLIVFECVKYLSALRFCFLAVDISVLAHRM